MSSTKEQIDAVRTQRLRGIREAIYGNRTVIYTSDAEKRQLEQDLQREINTQSGRPRQSNAFGEKGLLR